MNFVEAWLSLMGSWLVGTALIFALGTGLERIIHRKARP